MKLGMVGLPNVGKSTLFNALTNAGAESANYPFCTIEKMWVSFLCRTLVWTNWQKCMNQTSSHRQRWNLWTLPVW